MIIALQTLIFFRESLFKTIDRLLRPYYKHFSLAFNNGNDDEDDESDEQVFADFDDERGVVFYPPVYAQRYATVSDCLMDVRWHGKIEKVVDLGYHDMSFIKYLKEVPGIRQILGVDIESIPLRCSSDLLGCEEYVAKRENPLQVTLFQGNAADPDFRLIGCDAVIGIEVIEHMLPHDLDRLVHNVFGFIRPWIVIFTTPNADFNVLFNSLEKNGLRRWDHFFEWSREQFNDWCSNIVVRYPDYTVSCQGIGPGPPGTSHLGCCSQMALFVVKDYHKQEDLNLNSLALVAKMPSANTFSEMVDNWESPENLTEAMICAAQGVESLSEFPFPVSAKHSYATIVLSPSYSLPTIAYKDKTSQCNLDTEVGKNFLMFDYEQLFDVMTPRKKNPNRVYMIEDVSSRLNCTTYQVKKFSKATQNLMAKNKIDSLVHTREVVDEIRHLTKALNFNGNGDGEVVAGEHIWHNINWGENAPYWNQYYKVVRDYSYPFETKSEDCRILELISDEINRLIDSQYDEEFSVDVSRLEIPIHHLMRVVEHITDDVNKVKDLLEWNGYEIVDDTVIHSRLVLDSASATHDDEWQENETITDWDTTDGHNTSISDGSTFVTDYHDVVEYGPKFSGRCLRRALDQKVRKLRNLISADEDITTELDRVVCRLMKLALRSSRGRQNPPPTKWMQCKLLDLLTLTEKAIERRKKHFIESYPLKAIVYDEDKPIDMMAIEKIKEDDTGLNLVDKYKHLLQPIDTTFDGQFPPDCQLIELEPEDDFVSIISNEFIKGFDNIDRESPPPKVVKKIDPTQFDKEETKLERTQAWVDEDIEVVPYPSHDINFDNISSGDTDNSTHGGRHKQKKANKRYSNIEGNIKVWKTSHTKSAHKRRNKQDKNKRKSSSTRISKIVTRKKSNALVKHENTKYVAIEFGSNVIKSKNNTSDRNLLIEATKPIPESITEICPPKIIAEDLKDVKLSSSDAMDLTNKITKTSRQLENIANTKESLLINIVMDGLEETIALRRTVGTDADNDPLSDENEMIIQTFSNEFSTKHNVSTDNVQSQTIFLNDINEPSTSKGIRHVSMDVQCGPDVTPVYSALSTSTSAVNMPDISAIGVKMNALLADVSMKSTDFGTSTQTNCNYETITPRMKSVGIKIRDSDVNVCTTLENSTMTQGAPESHKAVTIADPQVTMTVNNWIPSTDTKLIKPISSFVKLEDFGSDFEKYESISSSAQSPLHFMPSSKNESDVLIVSVKSKDTGVTAKSSKSIRPVLSRGGVHVHSYRNKQVSEDVVFQGEWQRCRPYSLTRKKSSNHTIISRKKIDSALKKVKVNSKEKLGLKKLDKNENKVELKKPIPTRVCSTVSYKIRSQPALKNDIKPPAKKVTKTLGLPRHVINNIKVNSKLTSSSITTNNLKFPNTTKKLAALSTTVKKDINKTQTVKHINIPINFNRNVKKQKIAIPNKTNLNKSIDSVNAIAKVNKTKLETPIPPLVRSKTEEIKKQLLRFPDEPRENVSFLIYRNDKEDKKDSKEQSTHISDLKLPGCMIKRIQSYQSPNSSTCSSPNSVATVRAATANIKNTSCRRHSASSNKGNINSESDSSSPTRMKKYAKRCKSAKRPDIKDISNKENIPEPSAKNFINENETFSKTPLYVARHKNVYIAQLKGESSHLQFTPNTNLSKNQTKSQVSNKSNIKIPTQEDVTEKKGSPRQSVSRKRSSKLNTSSNDPKYTTSSPERSNMVLVLEPYQARPESVKSQDVPPIRADYINIVDKSLSKEWMPSLRTNEHIRSDITLVMRQIVEEMLDFIDCPFNDFDSETVILSRDDADDSFLMNASPVSFKTVVTNDDTNNSLVLERVLNRTIETLVDDDSSVSLNDTRQTVTDLDYLSIKSVTSVSKYSEYFFADNEVSNSKAFLPTQVADSNSVRDIFERKDNNLLQNTAGAFAIQAFSGFSLIEPIAGDQPDPVSIIDSETGSIALDTARQATSEELFVSGRSSDSYESCVIDEDAVVPNWLFNVISHQQSEVENIADVQIPIQIPLPEPMFDANGNVLDQGIVGAGAGAGDGRGMHSDHSQDSSGRGTSLSSSEVSSDPQSEAILIDPSAFTNQFELMREPLESAINVPMTASGSSVNTNRNDENTTGTSGTGRHIRVVRPAPASSGADADISSIDTDLPDSSDN